MRIDVFTLFPEAFDWFSGQRHVTNAVAEGSEIRTVDYRDYTTLSGRVVDDSPYGGGAGMVMRVDVVDGALEATYGPDRDDVRKIALTPGGRIFDEALAEELAGERAPGAAERALRGVRRAGGRTSGRRGGLDREVRAGGR